MSGEQTHYLVDSHAHLSMEDFDNDRDEVIEKAFKAGVRAILCPAEITDKKNLNKDIPYDSSLCCLILSSLNLSIWLSPSISITNFNLLQ